MIARAHRGPIGWGLLATAWAVYAAHAAEAGLGLSGGPLSRLPDQPMADALVVVSALICLARPILRREDRLPWLILGLGLGAWAAGDLYYSLAFGDTEVPPLPSVSDGLWLLIYPAGGIAMLLLARSQYSRVHPTLLIDGVIAALAVTATCVAALWTPVLDAPTGGPLALATLLAYPLADGLLLGLVAAILTLAGWRPDRTWSLLGAGLTAVAVADGLLIYLSATSNLIDGTALDSLFPAGALLLAFAAWQPPQTQKTADVERWGMLLTPAVGSVVATGLLIFDHFFPLPTVAILLAGATVVAVLLRAALTFRENLQLLERRRAESFTDHLTGLANRREFDERLAMEVERAHRHGRDLSLVILDLDHFKSVNDRFGHAVGDEVLAHVARELRRQARLGELVARVGGEEFAWLLPETDLDDAIEAAERARAAVAASALPSGLRVTLSAGASEAVDAGDASGLYRKADAALYKAKADGRDRIASWRSLVAEDSVTEGLIPSR